MTRRILIPAIVLAAAFVAPSAASASADFGLQLAVAKEDCSYYYNGCQFAASVDNPYSRSFTFSRPSISRPGQTCYERVTVTNEALPQLLGSSFVGCTTS